MIARVHDITVDCHDPVRLAEFWSAVLGYEEDPDDPNAPGDTEVLIVDPARHRPGLLFIVVPEPKAVKNRVHLDLRPAGTRDEAVERVVGLGGTIVADHRRDDGGGWVTLADPEGNELCIVRSDAERGDSAPVDTGVRPMAFDRAGDERTMLVGMLEWYRAGVLAKVDGVREHHARARVVRSGTTIAGLVNHLALVEDGWFTESFAGEPMPEPWAGADWDADPDWEFHAAEAEPLARSVERYRAACERSRAVTERHGLDDLGADARREPFSLRFVLLHLIEETARHLGHLDVLREHLDGTTGD